MRADISSVPAASTEMVGTAANVLAALICDPMLAASAATATSTSGAAITNAMSTPSLNGLGHRD
ncbi:hypothetical protein MSIMFI_01566 [Mycobacterium simulans]|nr:hypothetical protein MSIMFI_01566 [Mycobacterium simulans]